MSIQDIFEEGDTGEAILPVPVSAIAARARVARPQPRIYIVHNHDLDPTCVETRNQQGRLVGECLKVNDEEAPRTETPSTRTARNRDASESVSDEPVWGDVRHHRERIDQLNEWVRYWAAKARTAEAKVIDLEAERDLLRVEADATEAIVQRVEALVDQWDGEVGAQEDYQHSAAVRAVEACIRNLVDALRTCECPPCPGRGNDGHGLAHCAECCFGSGVIADEDCPVHGRAALEVQP